jgi:hypothetical protein
MNQPQNQPKDGVSRKIKVTVITFSLFTLIAFTTFFIMLFNRMSNPANHSAPQQTKVSANKDTAWEPKLLSLAEKLRSEGFKDKAIEQYQEYLEKVPVDLATRAQISLSIADLNMELSNFREALVWLYKAELANPEIEKTDGFSAKVDTCLTQLKTVRR